MTETKLDLGDGNLHLVRTDYAALSHVFTHISFDYTEHASDHWCSDTEKSVTVTKEVAEKLIAALNAYFNLGYDSKSPQVPLADALEAAQAVSDPVAWQFKDPETGNWCNFMNEYHRQNTIEDGRWEIRALYDHVLPQVPLTEDEFVNCLVKSGCVDNVSMTYPSGQPDTTRSSPSADRLLRAIEAHHKIGVAVC